MAGITACYHCHRSIDKPSDGMPMSFPHKGIMNEQFHKSCAPLFFQSLQNATFVPMKKPVSKMGEGKEDEGLTTSASKTSDASATALHLGSSSKQEIEGATQSAIEAASSWSEHEIEKTTKELEQEFPEVNNQIESLLGLGGSTEDEISDTQRKTNQSQPNN